MNTTLLRTFLAVARSRSFTAAAADLQVVQSTVTVRVKLLERELGSQLLHRLPGGVALTETGERLLDYASDVLEAEARLWEAAKSGGAPAGNVFVGAPESMCAYRLARVVAALAAAHPAISIHMSPTGTAETFDRLLNRSLDIGLVLDERRAPSRLTTRVIGSEPISVVAGPLHPAATTPVTPEQLMEYPFFLLEEGCSYTDRFIDDMVRATTRTPRITRFGSVESARACVHAGLGLSILPDVSVRADHEAGRLVCLRSPRRPESPLRMVLRNASPPSRAAKVVADWLGAAASRGWQLPHAGAGQ